MFGRLLPQEGRFFELFNSHAEQIVRGGEALVALMQDLDGAEQHIANIEAIEQAADKITHETIAQLHKSFITPLDRDEIHGLINAMDDILDTVQDVAECTTLYHIQRITPEALQLANVSLSCCTRVKIVVGLIANMDNASAILQTCQEIDRLETDADRIMRSAMSKLFRDERDALQVMKLKAIYEQLESITDRCEDVAKIVEGIVLENA
jgi:predicted phosphate transport protein (TIGR00153 family)